MRDEHSIGQEVAQAALRPAMHNEHGHEMQVRARVDVVRDAGGDDGEDGSGALTAEVEPGKEPIFPAQDQPSELTLPAIVGGVADPPAAPGYDESPRSRRSAAPGAWSM